MMMSKLITNECTGGKCEDGKTIVTMMCPLASHTLFCFLIQFIMLKQAC